MDKVDIFLVDNYYGTPFLSIPKRDIQRLSIYPHKWLRFVLFAICGAHGQLSATQKGPAVQDDAGFTDLCTTYYYTPYENQRLCFVDHNVHNDRITSTADTQRSSAFRKDIIERDRACVLTGSGPKFCDAAHIIPMKKGDAYVKHIIQHRGHLYPPQEIEFSYRINGVQNGILIRNDLHRKFGYGTMALLRTPNFVLGRDDIPRLPREDQNSPESPFCITMQYIDPDLCDEYSIPQCDARLPNSQELLPSTIVLDFMYGAAVYNVWKGDKNKVDERMEEFYENQHLPILKMSHETYSLSTSSEDSHDDTDTDPTYMPSSGHVPARPE